jgi:hypothetical protein
VTTKADLLAVLARAHEDLCACGVPMALVGGLAVSVYAPGRATRDADLVVATASDALAEALVRGLVGRGYVIALVLEHLDGPRLSTVRFRSALDRTTMVDVLFASSGIEQEIVDAAMPMDVGGVSMSVAQVGHLLALKTLSRSADRLKDDMDLSLLMRIATDEDIARARTALELVTRRGFARGKQLDVEFNEQLRRFRSSGG